MTDYTIPQWERSCLVTIHVQEDVAGVDAKWSLPGAAQAVENIAVLCATWRSAGLPIVHCVRLYLANGSNVDLCRRADVEAGRHVLVPGTVGAELAEPLRLPGYPGLNCQRLLGGEPQQIGPKEHVVYTPRFSAFHRSGLHDLLQRLGSTTLILAGMNFPNCPRTSIYQASDHDYRVAVVADAISGAYAQGIEELEGIGCSVFTTTEICNKPAVGLPQPSESTQRCASMS